MPPMAKKPAVRQVEITLCGGPADGEVLEIDHDATAVSWDNGGHAGHVAWYLPSRVPGRWRFAGWVEAEPHE